MKPRAEGTIEFRRQQQQGRLLTKPSANQQLAAALARDFSQVSSGLDSIATARPTSNSPPRCSPCATPAQGGCRPCGTGNGRPGLLSAKPPPNVPADQVHRVVAYDRGFGERLIDVPSKCEHASATMALANAQEQQAELPHQANVNAAVTASAVVLGAVLITAGTVAAAEESRPVIVEAPPPIPVRTVCHEPGGRYGEAHHAVTRIWGARRPGPIVQLLLGTRTTSAFVRRKG
jgi:hypothetical protein